MKTNKNFGLGIILIIIGVIVGLNRLGVTNINLFFKGWYTLFIIIPCLIDLFHDKEKTGSIIGLVIGILLLLGSWDIINYAMIWELGLPIILIGIGLSILFKEKINHNILNKINELKEENKNCNEYWATFSEQKVDLGKEDFNGTNVNAIFGKVELDLSEANILDDVFINSSSIFGEVIVRVTKNVNVKVSSTSIFGGVSDKRKKKDISSGEITIYINATCLFGGLNIK